MPCWLYFSRATNMAMHDLTSFIRPPSNLKCLLGLNLKYIPRQKITPNDLLDTHNRFSKTVYTQDYYNNNPQPTEMCSNNTYNPKLHIPSHWTPPDWMVSKLTVERTNIFNTCLSNIFKRKVTSPNLSTQQLLILRKLRAKKEFVIVKADKNLGPCILETEAYIKYALNDHLKCENTYKRISFNAATTHMTQVRKKVNRFLYQHRKTLPAEDIKYIRKRTKEVENPFPQLYLLMKVHKTPLKTRPVVSCSG